MDKWNLDSNKMLWHIDRMRQYFYENKRVPPILIDIGVTKKCNANCLYCYGVKQVMKDVEIPKNVLISLFRDAPNLGVKALTLTGDGENTLNDGIYPAMKVGKNNGLDIGMATNGIALNHEKIQTILESMVWCRFNISAGSQDSYKRIHRVDQFDRVIHNMSVAKKIKRDNGYNTTLGFQMVLIPECLDEVIPLTKIALDIGVDYLVIKQFSDPNCEDINVENFNKSEFLKRAKDVLQYAEKMSNDVTSIIPKWNIMSLENKRSYPYCIDLPFIFQISGDGKCYPCGYLFGSKEYCYGDLCKKSLGKIINSERYWSIIEKIRNTPVENVCVGCCRHDSTNPVCHRYLKEKDAVEKEARHLNNIPHKNFV